jgi:hypothetical protein
MESSIILQVLKPLDLDGVIAVHDFAIQADGTFDFVPARFAGQQARQLGDGAPFGIARPIVGQLEILDMLQGRKCVCGAAKPPGKSHCSPCYFDLPPERARALYRRFRNGYEQAFLWSLMYLIESGRTTAEQIRAAVPVPKAANITPTGPVL